MNYTKKYNNFLIKANVVLADENIFHCDAKGTVEPILLIKA